VHDGQGTYRDGAVAGLALPGRSRGPGDAAVQYTGPPPVMRFGSGDPARSKVGKWFAEPGIRTVSGNPD